MIIYIFGAIRHILVQEMTGVSVIIILQEINQVLIILQNKKLAASKAYSIPSFPIYMLESGL